MIDTEADGSLQHATHADLIGSARPLASPVNAKLDAIIVPAARPAENLQTAIGLAIETSAHLFVLGSRDARANEIRDLIESSGLTAATVTEISRGYSYSRFSEFETTRLVRSRRGKRVCGARDNDLSVKRNVGLLVARMLGWERIFFMDDDIRDISADALLRTVSLLGTGTTMYRTASMAVKEYPDNSVVCHARRLVGEWQDVFVSGSVLAVDCAAPLAFFPDIYNEDWLFFYQDTAEGRLASPGSLVRQLRYDPFENPRRATHQEFGDVIAEGLYALLHKGCGPEVADREYWAKFLSDRRDILHDIRKHLVAAPEDDQEGIKAAIDAAKETLKSITPNMCVDYVQAWQRDLVRWEKVLANLTRATSIEEALSTLRLQ